MAKPRHVLRGDHSDHAGQALCLRGFLLAARRDPAAAVPVFDQAIAVDPKHVPMGSLLLLKTQVAIASDDPAITSKPIARLVLAQDTGSAIVGPGRVDLFVGSGEAARVAASRTSYPGELLLLLPKRRKPTSR